MCPLGSAIGRGTRLVDSRTARVERSPTDAFSPIERIGGDSGWYAWNWLWRFRGFIDLLLGGVGVRRGRSGADVLRVGDTIDFWGVERIEPNHLLRLVAKMKLPGRAWLEFEVTGDDSASTIRQTAIFDPVGLIGRPYWYSLYPFHQLMFGGMLRRIVVAALHEPKSST